LFGEDMTVTQYTGNVMRTKYAITDLGEYYKVSNYWTTVG